MNKFDVILGEIEGVLKNDTCDLEDYISISDVSNVIKSKSDKLKFIKGNFDMELNGLIHSKYGIWSSIVVYDFDYKKKQLSIGFNYVGSKYDVITFNKNDGDLYISKSDTYRKDELFSIIGSTISRLYDELIKFYDFNEQCCFGIYTVNSSFVTNISHYGVDLYINDGLFYCTSSFGIEKKVYDDYKYKCNSGKVIEFVKSSGSEIFKKVYVKIKECPKWMRGELYQIRHIQIEKKRKQQKMLLVKRKIFPFLKET